MHRIFIVIVLFLSAGLQAKEGVSTGIDGPYIFHIKNGIRCVRIDSSGVLSDTVYKNTAALSLPIYSNDGQYRFDVRLHDIRRPAWKDPQPASLFIVSDPHGDMDYMVSILKAGKVIDSSYRWIFGQNHLMIIGDVFDRGNDIVPIFWLLYKLEEEAAQAGGKLSFVLGNHEEMVLRNNLKYTREKYRNLAKQMEMEYCQLWSADSELGRWLQSRNTMQVVGDNLFVHAGLSPEFLARKLSIETVNDTVSRYLISTKAERGISPLATFLFGNNGPLWYRGMVRSDLKYSPIAKDKVEEALKLYGVKRIYVGHTIFPDILGFYGDKVVDVNVDNKENFEGKRARAVLMEAGKTYIVYDSGERLERF